MELNMKRHIRNAPAVVLLLALGIVLAQSAVAQTELMKSTVVYREVDGHQILADVYRPKSDEVRPVIVWLHGGALINGNRERIHPKVMALAEAEGYALVSIDYRLAPETKLPALISDIEAAFRWLAGDGAKKFHLDPNRIVSAGESAGGYLALVTGYRVQPRPKAIVALYGYGSLMGDWYSKPSPHPRHNAKRITREQALQESDGSVISDHRRRRGNGSQIYLYYRQNGLWPLEVSGFDRATIAGEIAPYEPVRNVTADYPPTLLIHGTDDTDVPFEESTMFAEQLKHQGIPHSLISIEKGEHGLSGGDPRKIEAAYKSMREFVVDNLTAR
jgi:acetyl esterase/lipase